MNSDVEKRAGYRHLHICRESVCMRERGYYTCVLRVWKREKKNEQQLLIERYCCGAACIRLHESADSCREIFMAVETTHVHTHTHTLMNTQQGYCLGSKLESGSTKEVLQRPAESANYLKDASPSFYNICAAIQERHLTVK